jgi:hypothetical protein
MVMEKVQEAMVRVQEVMVKEGVSRCWMLDAG